METKLYQKRASAVWQCAEIEIKPTSALIKEESVGLGTPRSKQIKLF